MDSVLWSGHPRRCLGCRDESDTPPSSKGLQDSPGAAGAHAQGPAGTTRPERALARGLLSSCEPLDFWDTRLRVRRDREGRAAWAKRAVLWFV